MPFIEARDLAQKAQENWNAGIDARESARYNVAATRFYYACFQLIYTWLTTRCKVQFTSEEQRTGIHGVLSREFRKQLKNCEGRTNYYQIVCDAGTMRKKADYEVESLTNDEMKEILPKLTLIWEFLKKELQ